MEARPSDDATVSALDPKLVDSDGTEMTGVAADLYHALIISCQGKALKVVLTNKEGERFEAWREWVNTYQPRSKASVVGKLAEIFRTTFKGDLLDAITSIEGTVMIWEAQSHETINDSLKHRLRHCWYGPEQLEGTTLIQCQRVRELVKLRQGG